MKQNILILFHSFVTTAAKDVPVVVSVATRSESIVSFGLGEGRKYPSWDRCLPRLKCIHVPGSANAQRSRWMTETETGVRSEAYAKETVRQCRLLSVMTEVSSVRSWSRERPCGEEVALCRERRAESGAGDACFWAPSRRREFSPWSSSSLLEERGMNLVQQRWELLIWKNKDGNELNIFQIHREADEALTPARGCFSSFVQIRAASLQTSEMLDVNSWSSELKQRATRRASVERRRSNTRLSPRSRRSGLSRSVTWYFVDHVFLKQLVTVVYIKRY